MGGIVAVFSVERCRRLPNCILLIIACCAPLVVASRRCLHSQPTKMTWLTQATLFAIVLLVAPARGICAVAGQWQKTPHVYCGLAPHPAANVTWGITIQDCAASCLAVDNCSSFAFTDPIWTASSGCSLTEACSDPCTAGDCANWDLWVCGGAGRGGVEGGSSAGDSSCGPLPSPLQVSSVLGSHMVIQRDVPNAIWGTVTRGSTVVVSVSDGKGPAVNVSTVATSNDTYVRPARPAAMPLLFRLHCARSSFR